MKRLWFLSALLAACAASAAPKTVFEGKKEILRLDGWAQAGRWTTAECQVTQSKDLLADGRPTIRMHIPVDFYAGEKKYPVGWPRAWITLHSSWERDWTRFERFEFKVYTKFSRAKLPRTPVTLILYCPNKTRMWTRTLTELKINQWTAFSLPVSRLKYADNVHALKFSISESNYRHGDRIDFYIGGFRLSRSSECVLSAMRMETPAIFDDAGRLGVRVLVEGVPKGLSRAVPFTIRRGGELIRLENLPVRGGEYTLWMDIRELKLKPGDYELVAFEGDKARERRAAFRVAASPWR